MLREDEGSPRTLSFMNNNGMGGHNVLPYRVRQDNTAQNIYYIFVYDNNFPPEPRRSYGSIPPTTLSMVCGCRCMGTRAGAAHGNSCS